MAQKGQSKIDARSNSILNELAELEEAFNCGVLPALLQAIMICDENNLHTPSWVLRESCSLIIKALTGKLSTTRGRTGNPLSRYRADMIHFARWETAHFIKSDRENRYNLMLRNYELTPGADKSKSRIIDEAKKNSEWDSVYNAAAHALFGTPAFGEPDTIKESCKIVSRAMKDQEGRKRYFRARRSILFKLDVFEGIADGEEIATITPP